MSVLRLSVDRVSLQHCSCVASHGPDSGRDRQLAHKIQINGEIAHDEIFLVK
jgi:hypothetical protein